MTTSYGTRLAASFGSARRMFAAVIALMAGGAVALNIYAPAEPTLLQRGLASLLIALCALPSIMWAAKRPWRHSLMPYVGVLYAAYFAAPIFVRRNFFGSWYASPLVDEAAIDRALLVAIAGWLALMAGYFAVLRAKAVAALPAISVLPDEPRLAKAVAVVVGVVAAPFLYLDNAAVVAFYGGEPLLPSSLAFPVVLAGQFVVFAMLVLFYLHWRGKLGVAGRIFLIVLAIYYTILGLSTGMVNHGIKAVFALFMAYAVVAPMPTWRGIAYGVVTAAVLLFVLIPTRYEYRQLIWTHGVDAYKTWRLTMHQIDFREDGERAFETPAYRVWVEDRTVTFAHNDPATCSVDEAKSSRLVAFVHVDPADPNDLPQRRRQYGFDNVDFALSKGTVEDGRCVGSRRLPDYDILTVRMGLYRVTLPVDPASYLSGRRVLASAVGMREPVDEEGEWQLRTSDDSTWRIDPSRPATSWFVMTVAADDQVRQELDLGRRIVVQMDEDNWAEYDVARVRGDESRIALRLSELVRFKGDRSALTEGASALLRYEQADVIPATLGREVPSGIGRNPGATRAHYSLARKTTVYAQSLAAALGDEGGMMGVTVSTTDRLDRLLPLAWMIHHTPDPVPFLGGETYLPLLFKLVPRAFFEDKPSDAQGFGLRYDFVPFGNQVNAFKVHQLGELYANFGGLGILLGMFVLGVLYRVLYELFHRPGASAVTMAAGTHMLTVLMLEMESVLSVSWGFLLWYAIAVAVLAVAARLAWRVYLARSGAADAAPQAPSS